MTTKTYGQYCGLAKALDHVGDRWTLLIVRELLVAARRYSELRAALPGIATNLLAQRLRDLEADGIIEQVPPGTYRLTGFGRALEPAVLELVRWGGAWMTKRAKGEVFRAGWLAVALRALLPKRRSASLELHVDGEVVHVNQASIGLGPIHDPDAVVEGRPEEILGVAAGHRSVRGLTVRGDRRIATAVLSPRGKS